MIMVKFLIFSLLFGVLSYASSLDNKIKELKSAPVEQRYKIMNAIKVELLKLNEAQRYRYMQKLLKNHKSNHYKHRNRAKNKEFIYQYNRGKFQYGKKKDTHSKVKEHINPPKKNPQHNHDKDKNNHTENNHNHNKNNHTDNNHNHNKNHHTKNNHNKNKNGHSK